MGSLQCTECGKLFTFDVVPRRGAICFQCHVKDVNIGFRYGQNNFHDTTLREQEREILGNAEANGIEVEYLGNK